MKAIKILFMKTTINYIFNIKKAFKLIIILLTIIFVGCDTLDCRLKIKNNSQHKIVHIYSFDSTFLNTIEDYPNILVNSTDWIRPLDTLYIHKNGGSKVWSRLINGSINKKIFLLFIEVDTLLKYKKLEYIIKNRIYKKYEYTEEELDKINWLIEYP